MSIIYLMFPILIMASVPLSDDRNCDEQARKLDTLEGVLRLYGNEPFTRVALVTDAEERFFLMADNDKIGRLWSDQRGLIRITGTVVKKYYLGKPAKFIDVKKYEWIKDDK